MDDLTDHDLLIRIDERVTKLDRCMSNHFKQHWAILLAAGTAMLGALLSVVVVVFKGF